MTHHIPPPRLRPAAMTLLCCSLASSAFATGEVPPPACHTSPSAAAEADVEAPTAMPQSGGEQQRAQVRIPNVELVDQQGEPVHFYTDLIAGRVVAINFIFTTCTTICPPMGATFGKLERLLDQSGSEARLISISVDPAVDTPARLEAWAKNFDAGSRWTLVTGSVPEVNSLLKALGVFSSEKTDHSPVALIVNGRTGEWLRTSGFAAPAKMAAELERIAVNPGRTAAVAAEVDP